MIICFVVRHVTIFFTLLFKQLSENFYQEEVSDLCV